MPVLKHKEPCDKCPWRRTSARGWLGADDPEHFLGSTEVGLAMPCHCAIDYEDEDWYETQYPEAPFCAGALIYLRNSCTLPIFDQGGVPEAMAQVEQDHETVFTFRNEFLEYHKVPWANNHED